MKIAITGAAGNLGSLLSESFLKEDVTLNLLYHKKPITSNLLSSNKVTAFQIDLAKLETLTPALKDVDAVVHFAGVLFKGNPQKFLPITNTQYFKNLLSVAEECKVKRIVLVSFPHTEGETTPEHPATGRLDGNPISVHAQTRREEEVLLMQKQDRFRCIIARCGMIYGKDIIMMDACKWFSKHWIMGMWKKPTWIHLISKEDFCSALKQTVLNPNSDGIYHIGDDGKQTLQEFVDEACRYWGTRKPWRMPDWMVYTAAWCMEQWSLLTGSRSPLTRDFVKIGHVSYYGDTTRMKIDLLPNLKYPTFKDGIETM